MGSTVAGPGVAVGVAVGTGVGVNVGVGVAVDNTGGTGVAVATGTPGVGVAVGGTGVGVSVTPGGTSVGVGVGACRTAITANTEKPPAAAEKITVHVARSPSTVHDAPPLNTSPSSAILVITMVLPRAKRLRTHFALTFIETVFEPRLEFVMLVLVT